jgi:hypothetical protein
MTNVYRDGPWRHEGRDVLGLRIDFEVPLAVGEFNDFDDLERVDPCAKRKEINDFNVKRL